MTTTLELLHQIVGRSAEAFAEIGRHLNHEQISPLLTEIAADLEAAATVLSDLADAAGPETGAHAAPVS